MGLSHLLCLLQLLKQRSIRKGVVCLRLDLQRRTGWIGRGLSRLHGRGALLSSGNDSGKTAGPDGHVDRAVFKGLTADDACIVHVCTSAVSEDCSHRSQNVMKAKNISMDIA